MPTISIFFGILIKIYYREHNPPHFHAYYQAYEAIYDIQKVHRMAGKLPPKAEKIVIEWAKEYRFELMNNWNLMEKGKPLHKIPGADQ